MKSHIGYCLTLGNGSPLSSSNTKEELRPGNPRNRRCRTVGFVGWSSRFLKFQVPKYPTDRPSTEETGF